MKVIAAGISALAAGIAALGGIGGGGSETYLVRAHFEDAAGVPKNAEVRLGGVVVGKVNELELTETDEAVLELEIDAGAAPLGVDAKARIRSKNLLGAKYVDIDPGDVERPAPTGGEIPKARTSTPVELDDLFAVLDPDTRDRLRILIHESGIAFAGRGADFNRLLFSLPSALDKTGELVAEFARDNRSLARLLVESDRLIDSLAGERRSLGDFVASAEGALSATASRREQLGETIEEAPGALRQLRRTLRELGRASGQLEPAAVWLRRISPELTQLLRELPAVEPDARTALLAAEDAVPELMQIATEGTPLVRRLRPTASSLSRFAATLDPVSRTFDQGIGDFLGVMEGWARTIQGRDGASHVFRGEVTVNQELATTLIDRYVRPPALRGTRAPRRRPRPARERAQAVAPSRRSTEDGARPGAARELELPRAGGVPKDYLLDYLLGP